MGKRKLSLAVWLSVAVAHVGAAAQSPELPSGWVALEEATLTLAPPVANTSLGSAVALDGDTAVITSAAGAHVYTRTGATWVEQALLTGPANSAFGSSVAIEGDTIVVGASLADTKGAPGSGKVFVFVRSGASWTQESALVAKNLKGGDRFGEEVAISGDTIVVGAPYDDTAVAKDIGAAYVFARSGTTWSEQAKLQAGDGTAQDRFGTSVDLEGDTVVVGAPYRGLTSQPLLGGVYVFERSGSVWTEDTILIPNPPITGLDLGRSVSISGDSVLAGTPTPLPSLPSAIVFERNGSGWSEKAALVAEDARPGSYPGWSVSLVGDVAVLGSPVLIPGLPPEPGAAHVFSRQASTWQPVVTVFPESAERGQFFGDACALSGNTLLAGSFNETVQGVKRSGTARLYRLGNTAPQSYCTAGTSSSGCTAAIDATGEPSATETNGFVLGAVNLEGHRAAMFFFGTSGRLATPWGNGTSFQCVVPPLSRGSLLFGSGSVGSCDGTVSQDMNAFWCATCPSPGSNPGAGSIVQAQLWYRDPLSTSNRSTSLSGGVEFFVRP